MANQKRVPLTALQQVKAIKEAVSGQEANKPDLATVAGTVQPLPPSRAGKVHIGGYFPPEWKRTMLLLQMQQGKKFQAQLEEALTDLFRKYNAPVPDNKNA